MEGLTCNREKKKYYGTLHFNMDVEIFFLEILEYCYENHGKYVRGEVKEIVVTQLSAYSDSGRGNMGE